MHVSPSEITAFLRCRRAWNWECNQHLTPKGEANPTLWLGTGIHAALERFYGLPLADAPLIPPSKPAPMQETFRAWLKAPDQLTALSSLDAERYRTTAELGLAMCATYDSAYGPAALNDPDIGQMLTGEQQFVVPLPETPHKLVGRIDGLFRDRLGLIWLVDHKTYTSRPNPTVLQLNQQFRSYSWAFQELAEMGTLTPFTISRDDHIQGVLWNGLRKQKPGPTVRAPLLEREWIDAAPYRQRYAYGQMLASITSEMERARQVGVLYPSPSDHCGWCSFSGACSAQQMGEDYEWVLRAAFEVAPPRGEVYVDERTPVQETL